MRLTRIYQNVSLASNTQITLSVETVKHLITVLRLKAGDEFIIFNGEGGEYRAVIETIDKKTVTARIQPFIDRQVESSLQIHLFQCLAKSEKMDLVIQKSVELGVTEITPVLSRYSNINLSTERMNKKQEHWRRIAVHAAEQSGRTKISSIHSPQNFDMQLFRGISDIDLRLILHPTAKNTLHGVLAKQIKPKSIAIIIGPEGGLSEDEISLAEQHQFVPISLGSRILRTETAPVSVLSILQFVWGDFV